LDRALAGGTGIDRGGQDAIASESQGMIRFTGDGFAELKGSEQN